MKELVGTGFRVVDNFQKTKNVISTPIINNQNTLVDISIVIPTYQRYETLIDTLKSAISQNIGDLKINYEIVVVDNNPVRGCQTEEFLMEEYGNRENFRYYKNSENIGLFGNWNRCFELANGKWVILLHDDDFIYTDFITCVWPILKTKPDVAILKPNMQTWRQHNGAKFQGLMSSDPNSKGSFVKVNTIDYIFMGNYMGAPTGCVFNKTIVCQNGGFNIDLYPSADTIFTLFTASTNKVLLYSKELGVQRLGINETLKEKTLTSFMVSRYTVISYLIEKYKLSWLLGGRYKSFCLTKFYYFIQDNWKKDFEFDFGLLDKNIRVLKTNYVASLIILMYRIYRKTINVLYKI